MSMSMIKLYHTTYSFVLIVFSRSSSSSVNRVQHKEEGDWMFKLLSTSNILSSHIYLSMPMPKPMPIPMLKTMSWCLSQQILAFPSETELVNGNGNDKAKPLSILLCFNSVFN